MKKILLRFAFVLAVAIMGASGAGASAQGMPALDPSDPANWQSECIYCPKWFDQMSSRSAAYDSCGVLHAAYGGEHLYYGHYSAGGEWNSEIVDDTYLVGLHVSLALDSSDQPHFLYQSQAADTYLYAYKQAGIWQIEALPYGSVLEPSLALDQNDEVGVSFLDGDTLDLVYGHRGTSTWAFTTVDESGEVGAKSSLAIDSGDEAHIAYHDISNDCVKYAEFSSPDWLITDFCEPSTEINALALAIDSGDAPHIVSLGQVSGTDTLTYRHWTGSMWEREDEVVAFAGSAGNGFGSISMGLDGADLPHVSFDQQFSFAYAGYVIGLQVGHRSLTGWQFEDVYALPIPFFYSTAPWYSTVLMNPDGNASIVYKYPNVLGFLDDDVSTGWQNVTLDRSGFANSAPSLDWHPDGYAQVSFYDHEGPFVRHAIREDTGWMTEADQSGIWSWGLKKTVLQSDANGRDHLFWIGGSRYRACLHYTFGDFSDGPYCTLAPLYYDAVVDGEGKRHLAAYEEVGTVTEAGLKYYAMVDDFDWSDYELIDSHGEEVSIDADSEGVPHVVYAGSPLNYAVRTGTGWDLSTIPGASGEYPDLKIDSLDHLHVVYFTSTEHLGHAEFDGSSWVVEVIDDASDVGRHPSLAIDPSDGLHISYYDGTTADLKYAYDDGSGWQFVTLVSEGSAGYFSSITVDNFGFPKIAYLDSDNSDLMYIYQEFVPEYFYYLPIIGRD